MTKNQLKELMEYLSAIDNRQLTAEKLQVWFDLIGYLDFDDAKAAVIEAQRDSSIGYVEAKHVSPTRYGSKSAGKQKTNAPGLRTQRQNAREILTRFALTGYAY